MAEKEIYYNWYPEIITMRPEIGAGVQAHSSWLFRCPSPQTHKPDDIAGNEGGALAEQESQS